MKSPVITKENTDCWTAVYALVGKINGMKSPEEFKSITELPRRGIKEIYERLHGGWRKRAFRSLVMKGSCIIEHWAYNGTYSLLFWSPYRRIDQQTKLCPVSMHCYGYGPLSMEDYIEKKTEWSWSQLCTALLI